VSGANETQAWTEGATKVEKFCQGTSEPRSIFEIFPDMLRGMEADGFFKICLF
jgi:hypothetical protein